MRPTPVVRLLTIVLAATGLALPAGASAPASAGQATVGVAATVTASSVAVGFQHSCALTSGGGVRCWGDNEFGQLGNGSASAGSTRAVPVSGLTAGVVQLAAGEDHTCAVTAQSRVRCWGSNTWGMLGNGSLTDARAPVPVAGLTGVRQIAPGGSHTCALTTPTTPSGGPKGRGDVWCWGLNEAGELGDGTTTQSTTPRAVVGLPRPAIDVTAGVHHTCALLDDRSVWCWGWNFRGQLGTGDGFDTRVPTRIPVPAVVDVTARLEATCATTTTGTAYCWGRTGFYVGDTKEDLSPTRVDGIGSGATAIAPGHSATCGVISGSARCWGNSYELSGLGDGRTLSAWLPVTVRGLSTGVRSVDTNYFHQCAVTGGGAVRCWGVNAHGQLGDGSHHDSGVPVAVTLPATTTLPATSTHEGSPAPVRATSAPAATPVRAWNHSDATPQRPQALVRNPAPTSAAAVQPVLAQVAVGDSHACARTAAGALYCWGSNIFGAVGVPYRTGTYRYDTPQPVPGMGSGVSWVSAGGGHTCVVKNGSVWCWGTNGQHEVSPSTRYQVETPTRVAGISGRVIQVEAAYWSTCALTEAGAVTCWGTDYSGLGDGHSVSSATPVQVKGLTSGVTSLSGGAGTCAVRSSGQLWCWGYNSNGELGNGTTTSSPVPVQVTGLPGRVTRATRGTVTCALTEVAGGARQYCWGYGRSGGLGTGTQHNALTPVPVPALGTGVTSISSGNGTCAVGSTGTVRCSGSAAYGIGNPTVYGTLVPVTVPTRPATQVDVGYYGGCVALASGGAACWGVNHQGQLGAGLSAFLSTVPVTVRFP